VYLATTQIPTNHCQVLAPRACERGGLGLKPFIELDILQKFYYLRKED